MSLAVLASGSGTILDAIASKGLRVSLVLVDRSCPAMHVADKHGITCELVERTSFGPDFDRDEYTRQISKRLSNAGVKLVAMAGFGTILSEPIYDDFGSRVLNTHPSLLPAFPGWHPVADALDAGVDKTGCTVHEAIPEVDAGEILAQKEVPICAGDTVESLHERIKGVERELYPRIIREFVENGYERPETP